jgi:polar amino acid transport system substrate-binding protein
MIFLVSVIVPVTSSADEVFSISTSYQNLLSNAEGTGMLDRILLEAFDRMGRTAEIIYTPTHQSLIDVNAGVLDGEINRIAGMEARYPNLRRVPEPNMTMEFVAFTRHPIVIDDWESIRDLNIGIVRGWLILEEHTADFPSVTTVPTERELFNMLRRDRIDVALYARLTGYSVLRELGIEGITHVEPPLAERDMFLYVHKRHETLVQDIADALRAMKADGTYAEIVTDILERHRIPPAPDRGER